MNFFSNIDPQIWAAIIGTGAGVKVLDYLLPVLFRRKQLAREDNRAEVKDSADERARLREDIEYLRGEVSLLRQEVEKLEEKVKAKDREVNKWSNRYWQKKGQVDRVVIEVNHYGDRSLRERVNRIIQDKEVIEDSE